MRAVSDYRIDLTASPDEGGVARAAEGVYDRVWRFDFAAPGFCLLDLGPAVDSHNLRRLMLRLKERLGEVCLSRTGRRFALRSVGRFDQQETTRFHLDGGPEASLLMLGYEPSRVGSRLSLADYTRCAFDLGITPERFLHEHNPMFAPGARLLASYVTEVQQAAPEHSQILLINNSWLPFTPARTNPLGVMHRAEMLTPSTTERRIVNSAMLELADPAAAEAVDAAKQDDFVRTDAISQKLY
jgi:hypothetical protein